MVVAIGVACFLAGLISFTGKLSVNFSLKAVQCFCKLQPEHNGNCGLQTVAPKSMMAWLNVAGSLAASNRLASVVKKFFPAELLIDCRMPKYLASTRITLPSTTA